MSMAYLVPFFHVESKSLLHVLLLNGKQWYRVSDVSRLLGYSEAHIIDLDYTDDDLVVMRQKDLPSIHLGARQVRFLSRNGLVNLLTVSRRPIAIQLGGWFVQEVFPCLDAIEFEEYDPKNLKEFPKHLLQILDISKKAEEQSMEAYLRLVLEKAMVFYQKQ
jgi:hypothetical protein